MSFGIDLTYKMIVTEIESIPFSDPVFTKLFGGGVVVAVVVRVRVGLARQRRRGVLVAVGDGVGGLASARAQTSSRGSWR